MIKYAMSAAGLEMIAVLGLLMFFGVFVGVCVWVLTRGRKQVDTWSSLPLADGYEPVESRKSEPRDGANDHHGKDEHGVVQQPDERHGEHGDGGCGKCVDCSCKSDNLIAVTPLTMN